MSNTVGIPELKDFKNYCEELKALCIVNNAGFSQQGLRLQSPPS